MGRRAWRLKMVESNSWPSARAENASGGTTRAGQGSAHSRRCVSQIVSLREAPPVYALLMARRSAALFQSGSEYAERRAVSIFVNRRSHSAIASGSSSSLRSGSLPAVHSKKMCAGCSCPLLQNLHGSVAGRFKLGVALRGGFLRWAAG